MENNLILVSVVCLTFNHEKYIAKALDGFLMQKTLFPFEVIVHDDASTDNTPEIIRRYAEKYPDIIKPVFQTENKYSQGIRIIQNYVKPIANGKYIAFCEGDDYWTANDKLQKQIDFMENHAECSMCCHAYTSIDANSERPIKRVSTLSDDGIISMEKAISYENPSQLATQVFKRDVIFNVPKVFCNRGIGDYTILLHAACCGLIYFFHDDMANHRIGSDGSWTNRIYRNKENQCIHFESMISFLHDFDEYTMRKYSDAIENRINEYEFNIAINKRDYRSQRNNRLFLKATIRRKALVLVGCRFPQFAKFFENDFKYYC